MNTEDYDLEGNLCHACELNMHELPAKEENVADLIFIAMQDLIQNADDVYWISDGETVFERMR